MSNKIIKKISNIYYSNFDYKEKRLLNEVLSKGHQPIYFVHIRKTGGTSVNFAFLSNSKVENIDDFYEALAKKSNHRLIKNNKVFVGWDVSLINRGNYSYAFSHTPLHKLKLPKNAYIFTCLRDPISRIISHYKMLVHFSTNNIYHPCMITEGKWIGNSFEDFLNNIPKEHLLNQLYMFSKHFDVEEAVSNINKCRRVIFTDNLVRGLQQLEGDLNWKLPISNQKKYDSKVVIDTKSMELLKLKLLDEIRMFELVKKKWS